MWRIDPAGPGGLFELELTVSTMRALTSLLHLKSRTVFVGFQHYQHAAHIPAGLQITLCHTPSTHSLHLFVDLYFIAIFMSNTQDLMQSLRSAWGCAEFFPTGCKV